MLLTPELVTACLVTRGNVDLDPIYAQLQPFALRVWDNSLEHADLGVYGRYCAIESATTAVCYTQDDDVIVPTETIDYLLAGYEPGTIIANTPGAFAGKEITLLGFGSVFDQELPLQAFARWARSPEARGISEKIVRRCADVIFATLTPHKRVEFPIQILDYAYGDDRMYRQPRHTLDRQMVYERCMKIAMREKAVA